MQSLNVLAINGERAESDDPVKIVEEAKSYFPRETWGDVKYLGKLSLRHDVKIVAGEEPCGAFLFKSLIGRIGKIKDSDGLMSLLLGVTDDPVVAIYYFFDGTSFKRAFYLVHDYVADKTGIVSLFRLNERSSRKVMAHGLGHNRGLRHHVRPIDLMYSELLRSPTLQVEGFCDVCLGKLHVDSTIDHPPTAKSDGEKKSRISL